MAGIIVKQFSFRRKLVECTTGILNKTVRMDSTMKAWELYSYGGIEKLQFSENAVVGCINSPEEVLVEVHAASVNPMDIAMLGGYGAATLPNFQQLTRTVNSFAEVPNILNHLCSKTGKSGFPITLGRDFSGVVVNTGQKASKFYKPGDEVWGVVNPLVSNRGTHSEFTTVTTSDLSIKPSNLTHIEAASMPYVICTTWAALAVFGNMKPGNTQGKRALILGGSGGIGTLAIQLLKQWGAAEITTTCQTDAIETVLSLGANIALDYKTHNVLTELESIKGFDIILDCVNKNEEHLSEYMNLLKSNCFAHYVTLNSPLLRNNDAIGFPFGFAKSALDFGPTALRYAKEGKQYRWGFYMPNSNALKKVAEMVEQEKVQPVVDEVYGFQDLPAAFEKVSTGQNRGKNVIDVKQF